MADKKFPTLYPTVQLGFFKRLQDAEKEYLLPALLQHVGKLDIQKLDSQLGKYVSNERLSFLAKKGLRGELVFPVPYLLETNSTLLGYYRLLYGFSQKEFYQPPFSRFKSLEEKGKIGQSVQALIPNLCSSLIESGWLLLNGLPIITEDIINSLTLLTLGPQFRGSRNNNLGTEATQSVFALIKSIIFANLLSQNETAFVVSSATGRTYQIEFASDPDITIRQQMEDGSFRNRIAIEVKGGKDFSNIHNRLGEAEKSHQKAKSEGFNEFWTIVNVQGLETNVWKRETPTTNELFTLDKICEIGSDENKKFTEYLNSELGM